MTAPSPTGYAVKHLRALAEWTDTLLDAGDGDIDLHYLVEDMTQLFGQLADDLESGNLTRPTVLVAGSRSFEVDGSLR